MTNIIGWRWKSEISDRWQFSDGPEKPELGFTPGFEASVTYEPVTLYVEPPVDHDGTPFKLLPIDLETHLGDFHTACGIALEQAEAMGDPDAGYWAKQIVTIDRIKELLK